MFGRYRLVAVSVALALSAIPSARAADLAEAPAYAPAPYYAAANSCPPFGQPQVYYRRPIGSTGPRLVYANPPPESFPIYVVPQLAYIASDSCLNEYRVNWYEGKLFYYNGGTPQRPDTFVIYKRY